MRNVLTALLGIAASAACARTWTSTSGSQVEADFAGFKNNLVTLKKADGNILTVGLHALAQTDRDYVMAQQSADSVPAKPAVPARSAFTNAVSAATRGDILTDEQVAALVTEKPTGRENSKYVFSAYFAQRRMTDAEIKRWKKAEIPYRVTAELYEQTEVKGRKLFKRLPGYVRFYLMDEEKTVLVSRRESLDKMCPT